MKKFEKIIDCNFFYGFNYLSPDLSVNEDDVESFNKHLKSFAGLSTVVATSYFSVFSDPMEGDRLLGEVLKKHDYLKGCLVFPNYFIGNECEFERYINNKFKQGFCIIRVYPKTHKYGIEPGVFGKVFEVLDSNKFPVMLSLDEIDVTGNKAIEWSLIHRIAEKYTNIPIIIDGGNSKELMFSGYFSQLLQNTENVFLESHNLLAFNQIEDLVNKFGSSKLVLGSYFPFYPWFLSLERIIYSRMEPKDKENLLFLNLQRIMDNIKI
jgi:uncharacterized protein